MKNLLMLLMLSLIFSNRVYSVELNEVLPDPYPEVYQSVRELPFDSGGWYGHEEGFKKLLTENDVKVAIEVGCWLGLSTRHIASLLPSDGILYAVDTWKGSSEHQPGQYFYHPALNYLFELFLSNVIHEKLEHKIIPVRLASTEAAERLKPLDIKADFIYIDAAHDYESVYYDLRAWYPYLKEGGIFCGDDYHWWGVNQAVQEFASENNLEIIVDTYWRLVKKE